MKSRTRILIGALFCAVVLSGFISPGVSLSSAWVAARLETTEQQQPPPNDPASAQIYQQRCAMCHENPQDRVPPRFLIARRSAEDVIQTLTTGAMKQQAGGLTADQIRTLAVYLTGKQPGAPVQANLDANRCQGNGSPINLKGPQWNGWGVDLENSRYQPKPGLNAEDVPRLKVKWAWVHPGPMATGQPTIIGDRLYVTTEVGQIFCLNAQTGCTYWTMNAGAAVRAAMSVGPLPAGSQAKFALYFGDEKSNVQAVDAATGKLLWKTKIEDHLLSRITGSPVLYRDRIYVPVSSFEETAGRDAKYECCKFRGSIVALNAYTGVVL